LDIEKRIPPEAPVYRKRRIWASVILTIFGAGLAPIYCGYLKLGIWLEAIGFVAFCLGSIILAISPFIGTLLILLSIYIICVVAVFVFNIQLTFISNRAEHPRINRTWLWIIGVFIVSIAVNLVAGYAVNSNILEAYRIPSAAMEPTLLKGDFIIATKGSNAGEIRRGDIIVFKYPPDRSQMYIKRLIGIGGDTIRINDKQVFRNGEKLNEPYIVHIDSLIIPYDGGQNWGLRFRDNMPETVVPQGRLFVLGDNRDNSQDSRIFGFVDQDLVVGRPRFIYLSWDPDAIRIRSERIGKRLD
jgi:signal peptidase I